MKISDIVRILKYKNILTKVYTSNWSRETFLIKKVKNVVPWTYVVNELNGVEIWWNFLCKRIVKKNHKYFRIEKVMKIK